MISITIEIFLIFMLIGALIAVEITDLLYSVISIGAIGFFSSIGFLLLGAPDIAIIQMVVETLSLIILVRATIRKDIHTISGDREFFGLLSTVAILFFFFLYIFKATQTYPVFGNPVMSRISDSASNIYLAKGLKQTGSPDIVSAIVFNYRFLDVLGANAVIFAAFLGALAILRQKAKKKQ
ncbi:MAG: DUF4040 domain-containing protein [Candidatus Omnitrophica bacterium]|jgi:multisubunit Na+/H+ antiporter MnhB subunit|nr:DUF4040 domain-containing protein [Candidatus Omnitrophota bacterium]